MTNYSRYLTSSISQLPKGISIKRSKTTLPGTGQQQTRRLRTFLENLFNELSVRLDTSKGSDPSLNSESRRSRLAAIAGPFFLESLGEWSNDGKNFVNGIFKRLHPEGSHPGLSDDEDCTFRLHMILIIGRHYLRRYKNRLN